MRMSKQAKAEGHDQIVQTGARLIRERGIEGTSVSDVMTAAGRTHGGFYRHFPTKTALVEASLDVAFAQMLAIIADPPSPVGRSSFEAFARFYLSDDHLRNPGLGCPAAALAAEIGRSDDSLKAAFTRGMTLMVAAIAEGLEQGVEDRRAEAGWRLSLLIGAVTAARALDPASSQTLRDAALAGVLDRVDQA